jgi:hypothetical protein
MATSRSADPPICRRIIRLASMTSSQHDYRVPHHLVEVMKGSWIHTAMAKASAPPDPRHELEAIHGVALCQ